MNAGIFVTIPSLPCYFGIANHPLILHCGFNKSGRAALPMRGQEAMKHSIVTPDLWETQKAAKLRRKIKRARKLEDSE
jgi:hypothetical protein